MKKFLIILCCVSLLLPAVALSAFADTSDTVTVIFTSSHTGYCSFSLNGQSYTLSSGESISLSVPVVSLNTIVSSRYVYIDSSLTQVLSTSSSSPTVFDFSDSLHFYLKTSVPELTYYFFVNSPPAPPDPFEDLGVNDGVDSSISYIGQILTFLSTNTTTLVLIGLSVAMFAVLPFAIRKIKQIIKGY